MKHISIQNRNLNVFKYIIDYDNMLEQPMHHSDTNQKALRYIIPVALSISGGIVVYIASKWIYRNYKGTRNQDIRNLSSDIIENSVKTEVPQEDDQSVTHTASCHCKRIRFQISAPRSLVAVDITSKIRFPRVIISCHEFEMLSEEANLSMYPVFTADPNAGDGNPFENEDVGVHTFCSFCGIHVLFSPSLDPTEIHINTDCLSTTNVKSIEYKHCDIHETMPCPASYEPVKGIRRQGQGAHYVPSMQSLHYNRHHKRRSNKHNNRSLIVDEESIPFPHSMWSMVSDRLSFRSTSDASGAYEEVTFNRDEEDTTTEYFPSPPGSINGDALDPLLSNHTSPKSNKSSSRLLRRDAASISPANIDHDYIETRTGSHTRNRRPVSITNDIKRSLVRGGSYDTRGDHIHGVNSRRFSEPNPPLNL